MLQTERERVEYLPWLQIVPDTAQAREDIPSDHVERVAASIRARGLLQYIRVRWDPALGKYVIITGHCRWLACEKAKLDPVPCVVVTGDLSEETILQDQVTENELRQGFKPLERSRALGRLKALKKCSSQTLAAEVGLSGASIARSEALLSLPEDIQELVDAGKVPESTAYEISRLPDEASQRELAQEVAAGKLNRDGAAEKVRSLVGRKNVKPKGAKLPFRLDGGISITVSAGQPLTWEELLAALDHIRKQAKKLYDDGKEITALARLLRA
jgi:ParB family transcriptional regulator, chromosome partitioning protein